MFSYLEKWNLTQLKKDPLKSAGHGVIKNSLEPVCPEFLLKVSIYFSITFVSINKPLAKLNLARGHFFVEFMAFIHGKQVYI